LRGDGIKDCVNPKSARGEGRANQGGDGKNTIYSQDKRLDQKGKGGEKGIPKEPVKGVQEKVAAMERQ